MNRLNEDKILAERLIRISEEGLGYDGQLRAYTDAIRQYRETIQKDFEARAKSDSGNDEDIVIGTLAERVQQIQGSSPYIATHTTERVFDDPQKIE